MKARLSNVVDMANKLVSHITDLPRKLNNIQPSNNRSTLSVIDRKSICIFHRVEHIKLKLGQEMMYMLLWSKKHIQ